MLLTQTSFGLGWWKLNMSVVLMFSLMFAWRKNVQTFDELLLVMFGKMQQLIYLGPFKMGKIPGSRRINWFMLLLLLQAISLIIFRLVRWISLCGTRRSLTNCCLKMSALQSLLSNLHQRSCNKIFQFGVTLLKVNFLLTQLILFFHG